MRRKQLPPSYHLEELVNTKETPVLALGLGLGLGLEDLEAPLVEAVVLALAALLTSLYLPVVIALAETPLDLE